MKQPYVLGISCSHNGSACLLHGDQIVAAVQDERLFRVKRQRTHPRFVRACINYCLDTAGIRPENLDIVVYSNILNGPDEASRDLFLNDFLRLGSSRVPAISIPHHYAHAMSSFATSGFGDAAILVVDGAGTLVNELPEDERAAIVNTMTGDPREAEWLTCYQADDVVLKPIWKQSGYSVRGERIGTLGHMYGAVAQQMFGDFYDGSGKVMGLAPFGRPTMPIADWLAVDERGVVSFTTAGIAHVRAHCAWPDSFDACAGAAASLQQALEYALLQIVAKLRSLSTSANLCYAGGVALNSVANEAIVREGGFANVHIVPAAEDSGVAVGAAYHGLWHLTGRNTRRALCRDEVGRKYSRHEIDRAVAAMPAVRACPQRDIPSEVVRLLCDGKIVGWFSGGSELGPRALGQRSILCDPRRPDAKDTLNLRVKHREPFRPFAPVVLREHVDEWFDVLPESASSPFMLRVWSFRPGRAALVPAVAHVDNTARVQTITRTSNPALYELLRAFYECTRVPILLNTSFNIAGEPIVETPEDALWCLLCTELDCCVFEDRIVHRTSEFRSILDLRPRVVATAVSVDRLAKDGRLADGRPGTPPALLHALRNGTLTPVPHAALHATRTMARAPGAPVHAVTYASVTTRWGDAAVLLTEEEFELLTMIDGNGSGRDLLGRGHWTEGWLRETLAGLHRASIIRFH